MIWAGGQPSDVLRIDARGVTRYPTGARAVLRIVRDRGGNLWVATRGAGLLHMAPGETRFTPVALPNGTAAEDIRDVVEDARGRVWAAGERGLAMFANGAWRRYTTRDGLAHDHVSYIALTAAGDLWVAYFEPLGIARVRPAASGIRVIETRDLTNGLSAGKVYLIGEDRRGRLWIGTGIGVDVLDGNSVEHYSTADGLAGDDCDAQAFYCDERGHVFIGTSSGFSHYVGRPDAPRVAPPPVHVTATTLSPRGRRDFHATFAALTFFKQDLVEYEVRLRGHDDEWQRVSTAEARWSKLPPGDYRFEARARLRDGAPGSAVGVDFRIPPAWWQTWWARLGAVGLFAALLWLAYRWRVAFLRRRNRELQALVEQRTSELEDANDQLLQLSLTDALTGMKNRRYLQQCMPEFTRTDESILFVLFDLDHFKSVNDRYGHLAGDRVLVDVRALLATVLRENDVLVRWGGEEFLLVARNAARAEGPAIAERIRAAVAAHPFAINGHAIHLTCSIGYAAYPFVRLTWEEVVDVADLCLYEAKHNGRDRAVGVAVRATSAPATLLARMRHSFGDVAKSGELDVMG